MGGLAHGREVDGLRWLVMRVVVTCGVGSGAGRVGAGAGAGVDARDGVGLGAGTDASSGVDDGAVLCLRKCCCQCW